MSHHKVVCILHVHDYWVIDCLALHNIAHLVCTSGCGAILISALHSALGLYSLVHRLNQILPFK